MTSPMVEKKVFFSMPGSAALLFYFLVPEKTTPSLNYTSQLSSTILALHYFHANPGNKMQIVSRTSDGSLGLLHHYTLSILGLASINGNNQRKRDSGFKNDFGGRTYYSSIYRSLLRWVPMPVLNFDVLNFYVNFVHFSY